MLERPSLGREAEFLAAVCRSRALHSHWAAPPDTAVEFAEYVRRFTRPEHIGHFVCTREGELAGVINLSEVVRGAFQSGYLGYYAFTPHAGHGYMKDALAAVIDVAFREHGLHRMEANIQPDNGRSIGLVSGMGFRREGYSPKYLKLGGEWRDHERWALTVEDWEALRTPIRR